MKLEFFMGSFTLLQYFLWHFFLIECKKKFLVLYKTKFLVWVSGKKTFLEDHIKFSRSKEKKWARSGEQWTSMCMNFKKFSWGFPWEIIYIYYKLLLLYFWNLFNLKF